MSDDGIELAPKSLYFLGLQIEMSGNKPCRGGGEFIREQVTVSMRCCSLNSIVYIQQGTRFAVEVCRYVHEEEDDPVGRFGFHATIVPMYLIQLGYNITATPDQVPNRGGCQPWPLPQ